MSAEPLTPESSRGDAKRRAILDVAHDVFLAQGYAATSMSEIAAKVGGSKGTLYNYFRSKEELFSAFMNDICVSQAAIYFDPLRPIGDGGSVRASLIDLGVSLLDFLQQPDIMAVHRLVIAEVGRFPELGELFYQNGPKRGEIRFTEIFREAMAKGLLPPADPRMVGQRLKDLVMSDIYMQLMWGVQDGLGAARTRAHVAESVDIFLKAFGPAAR
ncbi:MAG TPA: TetR/AcrR family transcriptional regulator [Caulobacteraceae bacterium]|nr:TetR/AcrR family transcriptional regulator [Caulobacteraceae bacterium]